MATLPEFHPAATGRPRLHPMPLPPRRPRLLARLGSVLLRADALIVAALKSLLSAWSEGACAYAANYHGQIFHLDAPTPPPPTARRRQPGLYPRIAFSQPEAAARRRPDAGPVFGRLSPARKRPRLRVVEGRMR